MENGAPWSDKLTTGLAGDLAAPAILVLSLSKDGRARLIAVVRQAHH